jgi:hypothetical protein
LRVLASKALRRGGEAWARPEANAAPESFQSKSASVAQFGLSAPLLEFTRRQRMSPLTIFLAKFIGPYCIILAGMMMLRKQQAVATITAIIRNPPALFLIEIIGLAAGVAMIVGHNIWSGGALPIVVTLIGWVMTIRGIVLLALSPETLGKFFEALRYEERFYVYMGVVVVLGLYLTVAGFSA